MGKKSKHNKYQQPPKKTIDKHVDHSHWVEFGEDGKVVPIQQRLEHEADIPYGPPLPLGYNAEDHEGLEQIGDDIVIVYQEHFEENNTTPAHPILPPNDTTEWDILYSEKNDTSHHNGTTTHTSTTNEQLTGILPTTHSAATGWFGSLFGGVSSTSDI